MAVLSGFRGEHGLLNVFNFGGVANNNAPTLVLPRCLTRSYVHLQNVSDTDMTYMFGPATATVSVNSDGTLNAFSITNAGFGYLYPPIVDIVGGGGWNPAVPQAAAVGLGGQVPGRKGSGLATLTTGAVSALAVSDVGSGYSNTSGQAPYVRLENDPRDPYGCFAPSATAGFVLKVGAAPVILDGSILTTEALSIFCASGSKRFECIVMQ